ncbi:hypothetical protein FZI85_04035 [Mycobacterium sp. CBMA293]|uniref:hypothetical protein n=1 Tax=unclassified Mycolicibacterium TaxID=2636767 RepID=UPI0012DFB875|nr:MULTISPECIES: hypothetical protein [unclassified Mycolicibacterium]MUL47105.1 hypothetical protein [Mycolicibacterium sp. CBMA 360]MUL58482.1 hypothetical protein [Mycolicibacterium sp. CBMA 335]MUL73940.1 hypothetical protein [Mycolicibacterium sp. CBMA 311]MUL93365.1 hypothetical protein [Mycolicibacterium sp. CBMA 230]MUM10208.1 hypothetical protein [Mycolicibacterium sp. CBMA 293]
MSEFVEPSAPDLADVMRCFGYLFNAALEQEAAGLSRSLSEIFDDMSLPASAIQAATADLTANTCPLSFRSAGEALQDAISDADKSDRPLRFDATSDLFNAVERASVEAAAAVAGTDPVQVWEQSASRAPEWQLAASLELPEYIDSIPPVRCIQPAHPRGDRIMVNEVTYLNQSVRALTNDKVTEGVIEDGYQRDLNDRLPSPFYETLARGQLHSLYFTIKMTDSPQSKIAQKFGESLVRHHDRIRTAITRSLEAAAELVGHAYGVPWAGKLGAALITNAGRPIFDKVLAVLERSVADISLPSWVIAHTAAVGDTDECVPVSIMQLYTQSSTESVLHYAKRDNGRVVASVDYTHNIGFHRSGRQMLGATQTVQGFPAQLWAETARINNPICWSSPRTKHDGFRVLLPHRSARGNASYVSAVRAEVIAKVTIIGDDGF